MPKKADFHKHRTGMIHCTTIFKHFLHKINSLEQNYTVKECNRGVKIMSFK